MALAMTRPTKHPKTGVYRVRVAVPPPLRAVVGKRELIRSLGTKDSAEARQLAPPVVAEFQSILRAAREGSRPLTGREVHFLSGEWYRAEVARIGDEPGKAVNWEVAADELEARWDEGDGPDADPLVDPEDLAQARALLLTNGYPADRANARRVARALIEARLDLARLMQRRARGDWSPDTAADAFPASPGDVVPATGAPALYNPAPTRAGALVASALVEPFFARREAVDQTRHQVMGQERKTLRLFIAICGDRPPASYHRADVTDFLDTLRQMPAAHGKSARARTQSVAETIAEAEAAGARRLADKTVKRHLAALSTFLRFAVDRGHLTATARQDLLGGHRFKATKARAQRDAWTPEDLKALFASPVWRGSLSAARRSEPGETIIRDARFWLPILALYHGGRLEEFADLYRRDLRCDGGTWFLNIAETPEDAEAGTAARRLKTANAQRVLPLHPEVIRLGFVAYATATAPRPDDPLFPDLPPQGPDRRRGARVTRWFVEYRRAIKVYRPGVGIHAFRHTAITRIRDAVSTAQQDRHVDFLMGHSRGGGEGRERYDKGPALKALAATLALLEYPEVDLSHLHVAQPADRSASPDARRAQVIPHSRDATGPEVG